MFETINSRLNTAYDYMDRGVAATGRTGRAGIAGAQGAYRFARGVHQKYANTMIGRSLKLGIQDSAGWWVEGFGKNAVTKGGWLGRELAVEEFRAAGGGLKGIGRAGLGTAFRGVSLAFTGYMAYEGYQKEGVWGAAKETALSVFYSSAMHYAGMLAPGLGTAMGVAAIPAAVGAGVYALGEASIAHRKGLQQTEMGPNPQVLAALGSAGAATSRQRALMALNRTHLNARSALGSEAEIIHRSM